ncbi:MAG: hypothetical protein PF487_04725 [Bacteroidales bacterium]|nr:hypothetical protein [Bacteroidales bacterium]
MKKVQQGRMLLMFKQIQDKQKLNKNIAFQTVLNQAVKIPGVRINRNKYLNRELSKYYESDKVEKAIALSPSEAGVEDDVIRQIADSSIKYETTKVTSISAVAGIPGGIMMVGTIPGDITQYFAHILRILQKLIYLHGWQEIDFKDDELDDATKNQLTLFVGVMFGVNSANATIAKLASSAAVRTEKTLVNKALTKGTIYPIVKKVAYTLGVRMNKEIFAKSVSKIIPGIGAVLSGGITYATYRPLANRLKNYLENLPKVDGLSNIDDIIDLDFSDINIQEGE